MGLLYEEITLKNSTDVGNVRRGIMREEDVRQTTVKALVDTGCFTLVISEAIRQELGLELLEGERTVTLANETTEKCNFTEPVSIHWKDRHSVAQALVLPGADDVFLGAIPLEDMDLIVDPARQVLAGAHGDIAISPVK